MRKWERYRLHAINELVEGFSLQLQVLRTHRRGLSRRCPPSSSLLLPRSRVPRLPLRRGENALTYIDRYTPTTTGSPVRVIRPRMLNAWLQIQRVTCDPTDSADDASHLRSTQRKHTPPSLILADSAEGPTAPPRDVG